MNLKGDIQSRGITVTPRAKPLTIVVSFSTLTPGAPRNTSILLVLKEGEVFPLRLLEMARLKRTN